MDLYDEQILSIFFDIGINKDISNIILNMIQLTQFEENIIGIFNQYGVDVNIRSPIHSMKNIEDEVASLRKEINKGFTYLHKYYSHYMRILTDIERINN